MTWSRFDDTYDQNEKIEDAWERDYAAVGLHAMAITHCSRHGSDGVIRPRWITQRIPNAKERARVLAVLVDVGLFDTLSAGATTTLVDRDGDEITVGPFDDDRHIVHDYLHFNDSVIKVERNKAWDRIRKSLERDRDLVTAIRERDQDRCRYCGKHVNWRDRRSPDGATYDHISPRGENSLANVVVACRGCNMSKGGRTPHQAGMPLLAPGSLPGQNDQAGSTPDLPRGADQINPVSALPIPALPDPAHPTELLCSGGAMSESDEGEPPPRQLPTGFLKSIDGGRQRR